MCRRSSVHKVSPAFLAQVLLIWRSNDVQPRRPRIAVARGSRTGQALAHVAFQPRNPVIRADEVLEPFVKELQSDTVVARQARRALTAPHCRLLAARHVLQRRHTQHTGLYLGDTQDKRYVTVKSISAPFVRSQRSFPHLPGWQLRCWACCAACFAQCARRALPVHNQSSMSLGIYHIWG